MPTSLRLYGTHANLLARHPLPCTWEPRPHTNATGVTKVRAAGESPWVGVPKSDNLAYDSVTLTTAS